ncbi:hypothetical protein [Brevundimonas goettingensis]|uniref:DUF1579 domain-containing protein n=1 Tax=Brevundimonas goettingensis TaxID=2774190 RepID=A0A975C690_9CAUL|nr:hypothetical protein [Brevundimonas goettingensis]QTC92745.1 hypothetical protein IFJ75_07785 [Brevundimonas goettingensis]
MRTGSAKVVATAIVLLCGAASPVLAAEPQEAATCELGSSVWLGELYHTLSARAIEMVARARQPGWASDERLVELVAPGAGFTLVIGDVSDAPAAEGVPAAHEFASRLGFEKFRYGSRAGIPIRVNGCDAYDVEIEFFDAETADNVTVRFKMSQGRVVSAEGWNGFFTEGRVSPTS